MWRWAGLAPSRRSTCCSGVPCAGRIHRYQWLDRACEDGHPGSSQRSSETPCVRRGHSDAPVRGPDTPQGTPLEPGCRGARSTSYAPHRALQDRQVTQAPRSALFHAAAARLASGTHKRDVSAFEMQIELLGANYLIDDAEFW